MASKEFEQASAVPPLYKEKIVDVLCQLAVNGTPPHRLAEAAVGLATAIAAVSTPAIQTFFQDDIAGTNMPTVFSIRKAHLSMVGSEDRVCLEVFRCRAGGQLAEFPLVTVTDLHGLTPSEVPALLDLLRTNLPAI